MMAMTTAARNAMASATGLASLLVTRIQVGAGQGPGGEADAGRTELRDPKDAGPAEAAEGADSAISVVATITATAEYAATELGVWGRVGGSAEILIAYWSETDHAGLAIVGVGHEVEYAAVIDFRPTAAAPPTIVLRRDVPGPPGPPGDCTGVEARLRTRTTERDTCRTDLATRTTERDTARTNLATCQQTLATRTAERDTARADLAMAQRLTDTANPATGLRNAVYCVLVTSSRPRIEIRTSGAGVDGHTWWFGAADPSIDHAIRDLRSGSSEGVLAELGVTMSGGGTVRSANLSAGIYFVASRGVAANPRAGGSPGTIIVEAVA